MKKLSLSIANVIEKNKISSDNAIVFSLVIELIDPQTLAVMDTLRVVNNSENLLIDGDTYQKANFALNITDELGEVKNVTVNIQDQIGFLTPYLEQYRGGVDSPVTVSLLSIAPDGTLAYVDFQEKFIVVSSSVSNYVVTFELGSENALSKVCPARIQMKNQCSFKYMANECGYTGAIATCDYTLAGPQGCRAHNNTRNFGGFPSITYIPL